MENEKIDKDAALITMMIRISVLEKILISKGIILESELNEEIEKIAKMFEEKKSI